MPWPLSQERNMHVLTNETKQMEINVAASSKGKTALLFHVNEIERNENSVSLHKQIISCVVNEERA